MINMHRITLKNIAFAVRIALLALLLAGLAGCSGEKQEPAAAGGKNAVPESFTFFDLGANSLFSDVTRRSLEEKLGHDAILLRNMVNLEVNYKGFLKQYFPDLDKLNRRLNSDIGERIDHNTTKLTYRYASTRNVPFDYVEILFSNYSKKPILLNIRFNKDTLGTIDRLKSKYGPAEQIDWERETGQTLYWKKHQDYLMVSMEPDQFGEIEHRVTIYFTANLQQLIQAEQAEQLRGNQSKPGKNAF